MGGSTPVPVIPRLPSTAQRFQRTERCRFSREIRRREQNCQTPRHLAENTPLGSRAGGRSTLLKWTVIAASGSQVGAMDCRKWLRSKMNRDSLVERRHWVACTHILPLWALCVIGLRIIFDAIGNALHLQDVQGVTKLRSNAGSAQDRYS